ncbi:MAG TPA: hypothetical protein PK926_16635 [Spirochaetota bacterium]|nr:hypothetical protein [Spirochaetota bacterium]HPI89375.1 hypothetical protein [Spirochaetota bacterium]HPR49911.1 hypothetical protein [Spirochaetota bacterium]
MMKITAQIDRLISELKKQKLKPEYVIMGRNLATKWLIEMSREGKIELHDAKKYTFNHKGIPVVVCESEILEVVPNARYLLE